MAGIDVNPDSLRWFAKLLDEKVATLRQAKSSLNSSYSSLKDVWRDNKYRQFEKIYSQTLPQIEKFCTSSERYAQFLRDKEKPLRRYQERSY